MQRYTDELICIAFNKYNTHKNYLVHLFFVVPLLSSLSVFMEKKKGLIESALLPVSDEQLKQRECCIICLECIDCVESCAGLCCKHIYHNHCITQWLEKSKTCPICRKRVIEPSVTSSSSSIVTTIRSIYRSASVALNGAYSHEFVHHTDGSIQLDHDQSRVLIADAFFPMENSRVLTVPVTLDFSILYPSISARYAEQLSAHDE